MAMKKGILLIGLVALILFSGCISQNGQLLEFVCEQTITGMAPPVGLRSYSFEENDYSIDVAGFGEYEIPLSESINSVSYGSIGQYS